MTFSLLNEQINKALKLCGYQSPTTIQAKAIPVILEGKDVAASSQTGSGKTAAFVLPALERLSKQAASKKTRILILTPTRELAAQITKAANDFGRFSHFNIISLVGGVAYGPQIKDLARGADIIVATPGRLMDHIENKRVNLSQIEMLVLDEADRMLDMGFVEDVEFIAKLTPSSRQTLLFSATLDKQVMTVVKHLLKNPVRIDLSNEKIAPAQIKQELYKVGHAQQKLRLLKHFLNDANIYKAIIFSATKINADRLADQLCEEGYAAAALHGDQRQNVRNRTLEKMRRGKIQYLVATDVAARGIDIHDISHVINYDLPRFCEDYVHRIGRTGRAGKEGKAISFVLPTDTHHLKSIERYMGQKLPVHAHPLNDQSHQDDSKRKASIRKDDHDTKKISRQDSHFKPHFKSKAKDTRGEKSYFKEHDREYKKSKYAHGEKSYFQDDDREYKKSKRVHGERSNFKDNDRQHKKPEHSRGERSYFKDNDRDYKKSERSRGERSYFKDNDREYKKPERSRGERSYFKDNDRDYKKSKRTPGGKAYFQEGDRENKKPYREKSFKHNQTTNKSSFKKSQSGKFLKDKPAHATHKPVSRFGVERRVYRKEEVDQGFAPRKRSPQKRSIKR